MTNINPTPTDAVLVAIDISKLRNDVLIEMPGIARRRRLVILNKQTEHDHLIDHLLGLGRPVIVGFEATGNYHRPLAYFLHCQGFALRLIPTLARARTREAMHNSWDKNDPKDAQVILHLLKTGLTQIWHDPVVNRINDMRELSKTHCQITLARVRVWHTLQSLPGSIFSRN